MPDNRNQSMTDKLTALRIIVAKGQKIAIDLVHDSDNMARLLNQVTDPQSRGMLLTMFEQVELEMSDLEHLLVEENDELNRQVQAILDGINERNAAKLLAYHQEVEGMAAKVTNWQANPTTGPPPNAPQFPTLERPPNDLVLITLPPLRRTSASIKT